MSIAEELLENLPLYAENQLHIKPKAGQLVPFKMNKAQMYLHQRCEDQLKRIGKVRIVILKGRQQGCSTYVGARFYHKTVTNTDLLTFIFAHDAESSSSLYDMVKRFYDESRDKRFRPALGRSNAKELLFPNIRSGYKVGTAGTRGLGRSKTFQLIHWSEVAFSPNSDEHASGILQTVADEDGTEIIQESTANGQGNYFHRQVLGAIAGNGDYELVFIPWYWQDEYVRSLPDDFELGQPTAGQDYSSEQEYYDTFKSDGLTLEHLAWRRHKIADDFQGEVARFMREYPFTPEEAFEGTAAEAYIKPMLIRRACSIEPIQSQAPLIMGIDPARLGGDRFKISFRKGRTTLPFIDLPPLDTNQSSKRVAELIDKHKPAAVVIDVGGLGVSVYDNLKAWGYSNKLHKVDFGGSAVNAEINKNMTAEMFRNAREYLEDTPVSMKMVSQKNATKLQSELSARKYDYFNNRQLVMQSKKEFKKEMGYSPDTSDAWLLTFAVTINHDDDRNRNMESYVVNTDWNPF